MTDTRTIIRDYATREGLRYRISRQTGQVDLYGRMPNSQTIGWWLFARDVAEALDLIEQDAGPFRHWSA